MLYNRYLMLYQEHRSSLVLLMQRTQIDLMSEISREDWICRMSEYSLLAELNRLAPLGGPDPDR